MQVLAAAILWFLFTGASCHGGNYGRRTYRHRRPSWDDLGLGLPERRHFGSVGRREIGSRARSYFGGFPYGRGGGVPEDFQGDGGIGRGFPGSWGTFRGTPFLGEDIEVAQGREDLDLAAPSAGGGGCPPTRPSCTASRTRAQYCDNGNCGAGRRCCFDACLQRDVCKAHV